MSALQGFIRAAWDWNEGEDVLSMVITNPGIRAMMEKMLDKRTRIREIGKVHRIGPDVADEEFAEAVANAQDISPVQSNISWKMDMR